MQDPMDPPDGGSDHRDALGSDETVQPMATIGQGIEHASVTLSLSSEERDALLAVLERERTAAVVHGGLRGLLGITPWQHQLLLDVLRRL